MGNTPLGLSAVPVRASLPSRLKGAPAADFGLPAVGARLSAAKGGRPQPGASRSQRGAAHGAETKAAGLRHAGAAVAAVSRGLPLDPAARRCSQPGACNRC